MPFLRHAFQALTSLPGRVLISAALLALLARSIDWDTLGHRLSGASWGWFVLAVGLMVVALLVGAARWHALLHHAEIPARPRDTLRAYGVGVFSNNFLPTGFGGDAVRAWLVGRSGRPLARSFTSVVVDRSAGLIALFALGWLGLMLSPVTVPGDLAAPFAIATAAGALVLAGAVVLLRRRGFSRFLPSVVRPWASEVGRTLRKYGRDRRLQGETLILSLVYQVLALGSLWTLSNALELDVSPVVFAVVMPLVLIATLIPISVAGFGVREGAYVLLLGELGVSTSDATLLSLFSVAALAIASLPGGIAIAMRHGVPHHLSSMPPERPMLADQAPGG
jgi:glycosyltransferase 2 family protein